MRLKSELAKWPNLDVGAVVSGSGVHTVHESNQVSKVHGSHQREVSDISREKSLLLVNSYSEQQC